MRLRRFRVILGSTPGYRLSSILLNPISEMLEWALNASLDPPAGFYAPEISPGVAIEMIGE